ncbi:uncharacterized protein L969DRAFT_55485 [Mixia osmundae IAM 14324]|uniref:Exonuclease domain-containing protein n=1 Tax=Mixia osmundae (strain CBS 9802 / IAM 14324 / JCM 22182 / KY 12970) TaxID=764103 RepID=G7E4I5_MIXOS|nr:uncharacterized protein L969DRAFT_55485 [Mixia osmundae IAM 14324]KEI36238.1 hypothetical protein L969DRAFT_55485 [Mixia osmundae IAM 14324]GAA97745.1 hypothetical protein E5Q_04424 [Mixia osmundae IAM 14324]
MATKRKSEDASASFLPSSYASQHARSLQDDADGFTKATSKKEKKRLKILRKAELEVPEFHFNTRGFANNRHVALVHVRDALLSILSDEPAPNWLVIKHKSHIQRVVVLFIPGITGDTLGVADLDAHTTIPQSLTESSRSQADRKTKLPVFGRIFGAYCPTKAPGDKYKIHSAQMTFLSSLAVPPAEKKRREAARVREARETSSTARETAANYLLTRDQMLTAAFPMPSYRFSTPNEPLDSRSPPEPGQIDTVLEETSKVAGRPGWYETPQAMLSRDEAKSMKVLGIDCEMVKTAEDSELARVAIMDQQGQVVYDTFVKPDRPIIDYATQYSGITPENLASVTTTLADVQSHLKTLIDYRTILVGHSLECDLRALKLAHPWVIDTTVLYPHPRGPPFKSSLKWLAKQWLKREIQIISSHRQPIYDDRGEPIAHAPGHDPREDAGAAIELLNKKIDKGPTFGVFTNDTETIFERLSRGPTPKTSAIIDYGSPAVWIARGCSTVTACTSDDEICSGMISAAQTQDFVYGRMLELSHARGWTTARAAQAGTAEDEATMPAEPSEPVKAIDADPVYAQMNERIKTLWNGLPRSTALIILTGHSDPGPAIALNKRRATYDSLCRMLKPSEVPREHVWMTQDDRDLEQEVVKAKLGMSFFSIRGEPLFLLLLADNISLRIKRRQSLSADDSIALTEAQIDDAAARAIEQPAKGSFSTEEDAADRMNASRWDAKTLAGHRIRPVFPRTWTHELPTLHTSLTTLLPILPQIARGHSNSAPDGSMSTLVMTLATPGIKSHLFNWLCFLHHRLPSNLYPPGSYLVITSSRDLAVYLSDRGVITLLLRPSEAEMDSRAFLDLWTTLRKLELLISDDPENVALNSSVALKWGNLDYQSLMLERTIMTTAIVSSLVDANGPSVDRSSRKPMKANERPVGGVLIADNDAVWLSSPIPLLAHPYRPQGSLPSFLYSSDIHPTAMTEYGKFELPCAGFFYSRVSDPIKPTYDRKCQFSPSEGAALAWRYTTLCHIASTLEWRGRAEEEARDELENEGLPESDMPRLLKKHNKLQRAPGFQDSSLGPAIWLAEEGLLPHLSHERFMDALTSGDPDDLLALMSEMGLGPDDPPCDIKARRAYKRCPNPDHPAHSPFAAFERRARWRDTPLLSGHKRRSVQHYTRPPPNIQIRTEPLPYALFPPGRGFFDEKERENGAEAVVVHANYAIGKYKEKIMKREGIWALVERPDLDQPPIVGKRALASHGTRRQSRFLRNVRTIQVGQQLIASPYSTPSMAPPPSRSLFLSKLHALLDASTEADDVHWYGDDGVFRVTSNSARACEALATAWAFSSLSSFVRQLNYYGTTRVSDRRHASQRTKNAPHEGYVVFRHPSGYFLPNRPDLVTNISRRTRKKRARGSAPATRRTTAAAARTRSATAIADFAQKMAVSVNARDLAIHDRSSISVSTSSSSPSLGSGPSTFYLPSVSSGPNSYYSSVGSSPISPAVPDFSMPTFSLFDAQETSFASQADHAHVLFSPVESDVRFSPSQLQLSSYNSADCMTNFNEEANYPSSFDVAYSSPVFQDHTSMMWPSPSH